MLRFLMLHGIKVDLCGIALSNVALFDVELVDAALFPYYTI